jgi:predicted metalloprotease with PDZ domain
MRTFFMMQTKHHMKQIQLSSIGKKTLAVCGLVLLVLFAQAGSPVDTFHYALKLLPRADRTELAVHLQFRTHPDSVVVLALRRDYYGTPGIYNYIKDLEGKDGTGVETTANKGEVRVKPGKAGLATLSYNLSFDPIEVADATYAPNTSPQHFHAAFCQWMLTLPDHSRPATYHVVMPPPPPGWMLYSSEAFDKAEYWVTGPFNQLFSQVIGGSKDAHRTIMVKGRPLRIFITGDYELSKEAMFTSIEKIFTGQRDWFGDFDFPFFTVTLMPREDNVAGIRINNMFLCHLQSDVTAQQLQNLLSHEMFHVWLGGKISIHRKENYPHRTHWFTEGFTDYFAKRLLLDMNLISKDQFVAEFNTLLYLMDENPFSTYSYDQLKAAADSGRYSTAATKLQYYRGALMALNAEYELGKKGQSLRPIIRELHAYVQKRGFEPIAEDEFYAQMRQWGIDLQPGFERYILRGEKILPSPGAMGKSYTLKKIKAHRFDLGFTVGAKRIIDSVAVAGPAYKAGIRKGMEYVVSKNAGLFSNAWNAQQPAQVVVKEEGKERRFTYYPKGAVKELMQYVSLKKGAAKSKNGKQ